MSSVRTARPINKTVGVNIGLRGYVYIILRWNPFDGKMLKKKAKYDKIIGNKNKKMDVALIKFDGIDSSKLKNIIRIAPGFINFEELKDKEGNLMLLCDIQDFEKFDNFVCDKLPDNNISIEKGDKI